MRLGLNAHLLAPDGGYRAAGIHNYIHQILTHMPQQAPADWAIEAMVGGAITQTYENMQMKHARLDTVSPLKRIIWEQVLQPPQLHRYDLYHAMAFVAPVYLPAPMVVTVYDLTFMRYPERLTTARRLYLRAFTEQTCKRAKRILAISQSTADDLVELLGISADKIDVTPLGYNAEVYYQNGDEDAIAQFKADKGLPDRFWLFLGTIEPRKNLPMLIRAYAKLPKNERLPLLLAGGKGWGYDEVVAEIQAQGVQDDVRLMGFVSSDEIALWYNSAEAFLYPSVFEGFGLPVLEAMACGTPIVTSNVSSLPEVAGDVGYCLPPHDEAVWTDILHQLYHDAMWRHKTSQLGLAQARSFTWERTAQLTIQSYQKALS